MANKMAPIRLAFFLLAVCRCCLDVLGDIASTWDECNCRWDSWTAWSHCDITCFGSRQLTRPVWLAHKPGCTKFRDCAYNSSGWEYDVCNDVCHNGGTPTSTWWKLCLCQPANYGNCCENTIDCGNPGDVEHGSVTFSVTTYGGAATYVCDEHYNVTGADPSRTCQSNAVWSGAKPRCAFVNACGSDPCQNGATCRNGLDEYTCILCSVGWTGENCEHVADATHTSDATSQSVSCYVVLVLLSIVGVTFTTLAIILTMCLCKSEKGKTTGSVADIGHLSRMTTMTSHQHFTTSNKFPLTVLYATRFHSEEYQQTRLKPTSVGDKNYTGDVVKSTKEMRFDSPDPADAELDQDNISTRTIYASPYTPPPGCTDVM